MPDSGTILCRHCGEYVSYQDYLAQWCRKSRHGHAPERRLIPSVGHTPERRREGR